jgi:hypothetical protein
MGWRQTAAESCPREEVTQMTTDRQTTEARDTEEIPAWDPRTIVTVTATQVSESSIDVTVAVGDRSETGTIVVRDRETNPWVLTHRANAEQIRRSEAHPGLGAAIAALVRRTVDGPPKPKKRKKKAKAVKADIVIPEIR